MRANRRVPATPPTGCGSGAVRRGASVSGRSRTGLPRSVRISWPAKQRTTGFSPSSRARCRRWRTACRHPWRRAGGSSRWWPGTPCRRVGSASDPPYCSSARRRAAPTSVSGAAMRTSMATVVIGGQMLPLVLSLLATSVFYSLFHDIGCRAGRGRARRPPCGIALRGGGRGLSIPGDPDERRAEGGHRGLHGCGSEGTRREKPMPTVTVEGPRLPLSRKRRLVEVISRQVAAIYRWPVERVVVIIHENPDANVARGGVLLADWKPSSRRRAGRGAPRSRSKQFTSRSRGV